MSIGKTVTKLAALKAAPFAIPWILASGFVVLVSLPIIRTRVRSEERLLAENFGDDWKAYQREVPYRIFPYVW
jgi:protein-S-isoprenylcysteine O-methyltransferase Ste14